MKNSLVSIKTFVQLFPQRHSDDKFVDKFGRLVPQEINRLERMFKELSDFSSNYDLIITRVDVKQILDGILDIMREDLSEKRIEVKYSMQQNNNFYLEADAERLRQVFINLIINSVNAMPEGGSLFVSLDAVTAGSNSPDYIEVTIKDTGRGMSKEEQGKLFEPFHTTRNGGMGLGLAISRKIVELHRGLISIESEMGKGTAFIISLPVNYGMQNRAGQYIYSDTGDGNLDIA